MKKIISLIVCVSSTTIFAASPLTIDTNAMAGGGSGGTPPAMEAETELLESITSRLDITTSDLADKTTSPMDLLSQIKSGDLLKGFGGKTLIPLSEDAIRRLKIRASATGSAVLNTDGGEKFILQRDRIKDRLIDFQKAAEVIEKAELEETP